MPGLLATDLDGTLLPLQSSKYRDDHRDCLRLLCRLASAKELAIVFVTGRHLASILEAMNEQQLPTPECIICDVGSSIYVRENDSYQLVEEYSDHLAMAAGGIDTVALERLLQDLCQQNDRFELRKQEDAKQGRFKLSYYCSGKYLNDATEVLQSILTAQDLSFGIVSSLDPFVGGGLIDLMPLGTNKANAVRWWCNRQAIETGRIVFSGDSGNDLAALTADFRAIVVGNASKSLIEDVRRHHEEAGTMNRVFFASKEATAGVVQGCRHFGLIQ